MSQFKHLIWFLYSVVKKYGFMSFANHCIAFYLHYTSCQHFWNLDCNISDDLGQFTFSYFAKPPMTAGSTMPLSSMERGLMGRLQSDWYWLIIVRIFSFVDSMVSMAFSKGDKVVWKGREGSVGEKKVRVDGWRVLRLDVGDIELKI